jgi:hypothetical protein
MHVELGSKFLTSEYEVLDLEQRETSPNVGMWLFPLRHYFVYLLLVSS